ncbi:MAG: hypothetical protein GWP14_01640 [Actinobacteria bacterium]|nr:hypothetical protein [Actinomycetota bacterium]
MNRPAHRHTSAGRKTQVVSYLLVGLCMLSGAFAAQAAYITFHDEAVNDFGTGFGNVLQTLALQQHGSATTQAGSVLWNGSADVKSGDATNQSQTVTVAQLAAEGYDATNLIVVLNLNQTGCHPAIDLHSFALRFYTSLDGSSYFDAPYDISDPRNTGSTLGLTPQAHGLGTGQAGHVFRVHFEDAEAATFFANNAHRLGALVQTPMDNEANAGADVFYMADADTIEVIPEPATLFVLIVGGLVAISTRVVRRHQITKS